jgi:hypothetical protein
MLHSPHLPPLGERSPWAETRADPSVRKEQRERLQDAGCLKIGVDSRVSEELSTAPGARRAAQVSLQPPTLLSRGRGGQSSSCVRSAE